MDEALEEVEGENRQVQVARACIGEYGDCVVIVAVVRIPGSRLAVRKQSTLERIVTM